MKKKDFFGRAYSALSEYNFSCIFCLLVLEIFEYKEGFLCVLFRNQIKKFFQKIKV